MVSTLTSCAGTLTQIQTPGPVLCTSDPRWSREAGSLARSPGVPRKVVPAEPQRGGA